MVGKRPNLMRQEIRFRARRSSWPTTATTPWMVNPLLGSTSAIALTGPQADMIREQSAFDGPLVDYKERAARRWSSSAPRRWARRKVYHLKLTSKTGIVQHIYIDTTTFSTRCSSSKAQDRQARAGTAGLPRRRGHQGAVSRSASSKTASCRPRSKSTRSSSTPRSTTPCSRCRSKKSFQHEGHEGARAALPQDLFVCFAFFVSFVRFVLKDLG